MKSLSNVYHIPSTHTCAFIYIQTHFCLLCFSTPHRITSTILLRLAAYSSTYWNISVYSSIFYWKHVHSCTCSCETQEKGRQFFGIEFHPTFRFPLYIGNWYFTPIKNHIWTPQKCIVRQSIMRSHNWKILINFFEGNEVCVPHGCTYFVSIYISEWVKYR